MGLLERISVELLWFDSLGAKSSSLAIWTSRGLVVIDPGAAAMQPSYPLPRERKRFLRRQAITRIKQYVSRAGLVIVTHYHYDHHFLPSDPDIGDPWIYCGKILCVKNPNKYINESQWGRARRFIGEILGLHGVSLESYEINALEEDFPDPVEGLERALSRDYGDYMARRKELLEKGRRWFMKLARLWGSGRWLDEIRLGDGTVIMWCDGRVIEYGDTVIRVLEPWFHGIEYDRTGWVLPVVIEKSGYRIFYSSDLMGPVIEDYADYIIRLKPDIIVLDGPPTYLYPYMFNRINLGRAVENAVEIVSCAKPKLIIYDHHLLRERRWRERVQPVFMEAVRQGVDVMTASEYLGKKPLIDTL